MSQNRKDLETVYVVIAIASIFIFPYVFSGGKWTPDYLIGRLLGWE